ncbi:nitroreductase family protein [Deltaproteobacteria bacterium TL4]
MTAVNKELSPLGRYVEGMNWNPVEKTIMERRSIRAFRSTPLPDNQIRRILEAGRYAPSAGNSQPWKFVVVNNKELIDEMEKDIIRFFKVLMGVMDNDNSVVNRVLKPLSNTLKKINPHQFHPVPFSLMQQIVKEKVGVFHGAPTLILLLEDSRGIGQPALDVGICGQNMVLAAHSMGAGTCWIGLIKALMYYPHWRQFFGVKYPYRLTDCIAIGKPKGRLDGEVPREIQRVDWFDDLNNKKPRVERLGE